MVIKDAISMQFKRKLSRSVQFAQMLVRSPTDRADAILQFRYGAIPRRVESEIQLGDLRLVVPDVASALSAYRSIFLKEIYRFEARTESPIIIDCGANAGLSVLYFKRLYPRAKIIAFEPDPSIFRYLEQNIARQSPMDVELYNKALWSEETTLDFFSDGADGGHVSSTGGQRVRGVPLSPFLSGREIALLKIDIEGAEAEVLKPCYQRLDRVDHVFVEYHSFPEREQRLAEILSGMSSAGYRAYVHSEYGPCHPFVGQPVNLGMDMRMNLFFTRSVAQ